VPGGYSKRDRRSTSCVILEDIRRQAGGEQFDAHEKNDPDPSGPVSGRLVTPSGPHSGRQTARSAILSGAGRPRRCRETGGRRATGPIF
jgi:hypothetical protein